MEYAGMKCLALCGVGPHTVCKKKHTMPYSCQKGEAGSIGEMRRFITMQAELCGNIVSARVILIVVVVKVLFIKWPTFS